jgi:hypothetical protein
MFSSLTIVALYVVQKPQHTGQDS